MFPGVLGDIPYGDGLTLDAYAPAGEPRPAAIIFHGSQGNKITHVTQLFELLAGAGYAWFSVDYRTVDDAERATRFVRCPGRFNISRQIVLIGEDTGAEVALRVAARAPGARVVTFGAKLQDKESQVQDLQSAVLMIHGTNDREAPPEKAEAFCRKLKNCTFSAVAGAIHNFENWHPDQWQWKEELAAWLWDGRRGLFKDIVYARPGGRPLLMDAFIPEGRGPFPAVIIAHGGGWEAGDKVSYIGPILAPLARAGMAWFSVDYRLTPYVRNPEQLEDLRTAVRYVRRNAARFQVDPKRIGLLGESASGQMVTEVASEPCAGCEVEAVVSFYGVYDFTGWPEDPGRRGQLDRLFGDWTPETLRRYSPFYQARRDMPPVLLVQGTKDRLYEPALRYRERLQEIGARHEWVVLEGAPHGMENWENHPEWAFYKQRMVEWLRAALR